jgi:hypothetical protein
MGNFLILFVDSIVTGNIWVYRKYVRDPTPARRTRWGDRFTFNPTIGSKNSLIFIYFVHRYLPEKKLT